MSSKFEGPEKKLEIILSAPNPAIRSNGNGCWDRVVAASSARILSRFGNGGMDAYLLSESSLFVWDDRILMITCGKTTLVDVIPEILSIVGKENVAFVFYERKNFFYPHEQPSDFEDDAGLLLKYFPGKSYRLGPANGEHVHVFYSSHGMMGPDNDTTLQLLMNDLDPKVMDLFTLRGVNDADEAAELSGIKNIYPAMERDHRLFSPEGYSLNAIDKKRYFTIHVTPQAKASYVSFETNVPEDNYGPLIEQVVSIFKPRRFSLVFTHSWGSGGSHPLSFVPCDGAPGYRLTEKSVHAFDCGFGVLFMNKVMEEEEMDREQR